MSTVLFFKQLSQKLTDFDDFCVLNPEKIWHQQLGHLPTWPVYCSHCTFGNKKNIFNSSLLFIDTLEVQSVYVISEKQTLTPLPTTPKMSPHYLVKFTNFYLSFLMRTNARYGRVAEASCCDMGWILAKPGGWCSWSVAKKTWSVYPCRR